MHEFMKYHTTNWETVSLYYSHDKEVTVIINWDTQETEIIDDLKNPTYFLCKYVNNNIDSIAFIDEDYIPSIYDEMTESEDFAVFKEILLIHCIENAIDVKDVFHWFTPKESKIVQKYINNWIKFYNENGYYPDNIITLDTVETLVIDPNYDETMRDEVTPWLYYDIEKYCDYTVKMYNYIKEELKK